MTTDSASGIPFGEYRLLRRLGAGGMAEVFLAKRHGPKGFEKQLVIKRILPHLSASERFTGLFLKEARLAALIDHPHLVHVSSFGEIDGNYYLAMEYVDGVTVTELLELAGTLTPGVACRIAIDLLGALQAIHTARDESEKSLGLVHRDVSPRNVMITRDGTVKLLDFGIAVSKDEEEVSRMGTKRHMSPEQIRGEQLDARSDLFCVGVLIYLLISGEPPFDGTPGATPPRPPMMPELLWMSVERALAARPEERPASARQLQSELELFVASRGIEGTRAHLADVVSAIVPDRRARLRSLSRIAERTVTRILRMTVPLAAEEPSLHGVPGEEPKREWPALRLAVVMSSAMALGGATVFIANRLTSEPPLPPPREIVVRPKKAAAPMPAAVIETKAPVVVVEEQQPEEEAANEPAPRLKPKRPQSGSLTIDTRPWTEVYLGGRKLGLTPMEGVKLPSGRHELELRNPGLGINKRIQVTIKPGKTTRIQRNL